jgi:dihydroorotase
MGDRHLTELVSPVAVAKAEGPSYSFYMAEMFDLIIRGGTVATPNGMAISDVGVRAGRIAAVGALGSAKTSETFQAKGLHVLPGVIDSQCHFREPGNEHKEDLESGSRAAVLGGVTGIFEMPNTSPPTTTRAAIADKLARAADRMHCDYAFYVGATPSNIGALAELERMPGVAGVKAFLGSSTGTLLLDHEADVTAMLRAGHRRVAVHSEDEDRLKSRKHLAVAGDPRSHPIWRDVETARLSTERVIRLARAAERRLHVLHVTTADEIPLLSDAKEFCTAETTPQHLTLSAPECYERLGTYVQMNPPIRDALHREALWRAVDQGVIDVIGSDHAPHTRAEKDKTYPDTPSGMPGVQTLVTILLDHVNAGRLSLERFVDLTSSGAARIFGIAGKGRIASGFDADFTIVDLNATKKIENSWIASKCGWTPFDGMQTTGWAVATIIRGAIIMRDRALIASGRGKPIRFLETLAPTP